MKWLIFLLAFIPSAALAAVSGVDDITPNIPVETQEKLDNAITTYYQQPSVAKVNAVLDLINDSDVLQKKTSWPAFVGFLTVVFADNKNHVMGWITRNDYNNYAQDVIVAALLHAKLKESALVLAQAQQWKKEDIDHIRSAQDTTNLKKLPVILPGHIDTLWGAFFGSGDKVYVNEIINVLFMKSLPSSSVVDLPPEHKMLEILTENKNLAQSSLRAYALSDPLVRRLILKRLTQEKNVEKKKILGSLLPRMTFAQ